MPVSSIAQILLRLFALNLLLTGIAELARVSLDVGQGAALLYQLIPAVVYVVACIVVWLVSPWLSQLMAKRNDGEFHLTGVTERQLYATAFLSLGLYFALSSFANVFNWTHFFMVSHSPDYGFHREHQPSYYDLTKDLLTLIAGVTLMLTARRWAAKLTSSAQAEH